MVLILQGKNMLVCLRITYSTFCPNKSKLKVHVTAISIRLRNLIMLAAVFPKQNSRADTPSAYSNLITPYLMLFANTLHSSPTVFRRFCRVGGNYCRWYFRFYTRY